MMESLLTRFSDYFEGDGRQNLWVTAWPNSRGEVSAGLVYDSHNVIYAYGPPNMFRPLLRKRGLAERPVQIPAPHTHFYYPQFDAAERELMAYWDWRYSPLAPNDDDN
jgi:hypothetical protein